MIATSALMRAKGLFERGDFLPVLALIIAIQGTVLVSQSVAALFLAPAAIGQIRLFESVISIGILLAGFGAPALAIRDVAEHRESSYRSELLRDLLLLPLLGAFLLGLLASVLAIFELEWANRVQDILFASIALLIMVNLVRFASAVAQGLLIVRHIYLWVIAGSILAAGSQILGASFGTIDSWVGGRLLGEILLLTCILIAMRGNLPTIAWFKAPRAVALLKTMGRATLVNAGLTLRMVADAAPILLLGGILPGVTRGGNASDIGHFGVATLFLTAALLAPAVVSQRTLPVITSSSDLERPSIIRQFLLRMTVVGLVVAAIFATVALSLRFFDNGRLDTGLLAAAAIMFAIPMKAIATTHGTLMLAKGDLKSPIFVTLGEVAAIALIFTCLDSMNAVLTATVSVICGSAFSMIGMIIARNHPSHQRSFF
jgi:O-antigen/teichoic acid export membrane protein